MSNVSSTTASSYDRIVAAADAIFLEAGVLPLALGDVADRAEVSRSLIYARFPTQHDLMNAVLGRHLHLLRKVSKLADSASDEKCFVEIAILYFNHLVDEGPTLALAPRDSFFANQKDSEFQKVFRQVLLKLASLAKRKLRLSNREAIASTLLLTSLPEESAMAVLNNKVDREIAADTLASSINAALTSLSFHENVYPEPVN